MEYACACRAGSDPPTWIGSPPNWSGWPGDVPRAPSVRSNIDGSVLGCAERDRLDRILTEAAPHFLVLDRSGSLRCQPNEAELASLAARSGVVGSVAGALAREASSSGADAEIARAALVQLYLLTAQNA